MLSFVLLIAQMIPAIVMAMGFYVIYLKLGLLNTVWGLIIADSTIAVPFGVLIFTAFMSRIPNELLQAARIDGAGTMRTFLSIVVPVSRNAVVTVSLFAFLWAWSDFLFANTLDNGGGLSRSRSASTPTSATTTSSGTRSWPPPSSPRFRPPCCSSSRSATSPPA